MKKLMIFFLFAMGFLFAEADEQFLVGKLDNGLTYYIRENNYPGNRASLRLVVKTGSIYEEEEERGIAHFVEHMVFRGSRHFKDGEVFEYLTSNGAIPGPDTNAYTGFDSTVYQLEIPLQKREVLEKGFLILSDLAFYATFPDELVEREREVIMDEYHRSTYSSSYRIFSEEFDSLTEGSSYAHRAPIGLERVIKQAPPEKMRKFYHKWYRPDRMAVVAVGDFNAQEIKRMIEANFSQVPCSEEELEAPNTEITLPSEPIRWAHHDEELTSTSVSFNYYYPIEGKEAKRELIGALLLQMLQDRFDKMEWRYPELFLGATCFNYEVIPGMNCFSIFAASYEDHLQESYQAISSEIERIFAEGFTESEWNRAKKQYLSSYQTALAQVDQTEHSEYVSMAVDNFLEGHLIYDKRHWYKKIISLFPEIRLADIAERLVAHPLSGKAAIVSVKTPSTKVAELGLDISALKPYSSVPFSEERSGGWISAPTGKRGGALQVYEDPDLEIYAYELSNKVNTFLKPSQAEKGQVLIYAQAPGGFSSFSEGEIHSARFATHYFLESGFGGLNGEGLKQFLAEEGIDFHLSIRLSSRDIFLSAPKENLSRLFEILHHVFGLKQYDSKAWSQILGQTKELLRTSLNDPDWAFENFTNRINRQGYYLFETTKPELADEKMAQKVVERCFSSPQQFTFMVIGDFSLEEAKELSAQYLASIPEKEVESLPTPSIPYLFPRGQIIEEFRKGRMENAKTDIAIPCDFVAYKKEFRSSLSAYAANEILQQRLENVLRKQLGNTYSVEASYSHPFYPQYHNSVLNITYTSLPKNVHKMGDKIREEIKRLQDQPPSKEELATFRELFLSSLYRGRLMNVYWVKLINFSFESRLSLHDAYDVEGRLSALTPEDIQLAAQVLFSSPDFTQLTHLSSLDLKKEGP